MKGKLNGLSLFTGYAGIDLALAEYVRPIIYCEIERYAQAIILSRMDDGVIPFAPIWNDVTTLNGNDFNGLVDIVYGGFPCQDISSAGKGAGLEGKRSGLFYEVLRIVQESSPLFVFLENVSAIRTRGSIEVSEALASIGYDCRFGLLSAAEVGACHKRERWFLVAADSKRIGAQIPTDWKQSAVKLLRGIGKDGTTAADTNSARLQEKGPELFPARAEQHRELPLTVWPTESPICRANDVPAFRVDRIKALGNGVVPLQVKTAFEQLMGIAQ